MRTIGIAVLAVLLVATWGWTVAAPAETAVGTLTGSGPVLLRGTRVDGLAVAAWPVAVGDEIATEEGRATVRFRDQSRVTLHSKTRVRVEKEAGRMLLRVLGGQVSYDLAPGSGLRVRTLDNRIVPPGTLRGVVSTEANVLRAQDPQDEDEDGPPGLNDRSPWEPCPPRGKGKGKGPPGCR